MIAGILALGRAIRGSRQWLTLVAVAAIGAWLYVQLAETRADRDRLLGQADVICAAAGEPFAASALVVEGRRVAVPRGNRCRQKVVALVAFRADAEQAAAATLAAAMQQREAKAAIDAAAARRAAEALTTATLRMEQADAEAERRNRLDSNWWAAFNDLAGLRAPDR